MGGGELAEAGIGAAHFRAQAKANEEVGHADDEEKLPNEDTHELLIGQWDKRRFSSVAHAKSLLGQTHLLLLLP